MLPHATTRKDQKTSIRGLWFAHSASHGWVVLDRRRPENVCTSTPNEFFFTRCRDGVEYQHGDQPWNYREASRYLRTLPMNEAMKAERELADMMKVYGG